MDFRNIFLHELQQLMQFMIRVQDYGESKKRYRTDVIMSLRFG